MADVYKNFMAAFSMGEKQPKIWRGGKLLAGSIQFPSSFHPPCWARGNVGPSNIRYYYAFDYIIHKLSAPNEFCYPI